MEDNKIYQDNMECIKESNPYLWETLLELETTESEAFVDFSMNGTVGMTQKKQLKYGLKVELFKTMSQLLLRLDFPMVCM